MEADPVPPPSLPRLSTLPYDELRDIFQYLDTAAIASLFDTNDRNLQTRICSPGVVSNFTYFSPDNIRNDSFMRLLRNLQHIKRFQAFCTAPRLQLWQPSGSAVPGIPWTLLRSISSKRIEHLSLRVPILEDTDSFRLEGDTSTFRSLFPDLRVLEANITPFGIASLPRTIMLPSKLEELIWTGKRQLDIDLLPSTLTKLTVTDLQSIKALFPVVCPQIMRFLLSTLRIQCPQLVYLNLPLPSTDPSISTAELEKYAMLPWLRPLIEQQAAQKAGRQSGTIASPPAPFPSTHSSDERLPLGQTFQDGDEQSLPEAAPITTVAIALENPEISSFDHLTQLSLSLQQPCDFDLSLMGFFNHVTCLSFVIGLRQVDKKMLPNFPPRLTSLNLIPLHYQGQISFDIDTLNDLPNSLTSLVIELPLEPTNKSFRLPPLLERLVISQALLVDLENLPRTLRSFVTPIIPEHRSPLTRDIGNVHWPDSLTLLSLYSVSVGFAATQTLPSTMTDLEIFNNVNWNDKDVLALCTRLPKCSVKLHVPVTLCINPSAELEYLDMADYLKGLLTEESNIGTRLNCSWLLPPPEELLVPSPDSPHIASISLPTGLKSLTATNQQPYPLRSDIKSLVRHVSLLPRLETLNLSQSPGFSSGFDLSSVSKHQWLTEIDLGECGYEIKDFGLLPRALVSFKAQGPRLIITYFQCATFTATTNRVAQPSQNNSGFGSQAATPSGASSLPQELFSFGGSSQASPQSFSASTAAISPMALPTSALQAPPSTTSGVMPASLARTPASPAFETPTTPPIQLLMNGKLALGAPTTPLYPTASSSRNNFEHLEVLKPRDVDLLFSSLPPRIQTLRMPLLQPAASSISQWPETLTDISFRSTNWNDYEVKELYDRLPKISKLHVTDVVLVSGRLFDEKLEEFSPSAIRATFRAVLPLAEIEKLVISSRDRLVRIPDSVTSISLNSYTSALHKSSHAVHLRDLELNSSYPTSLTSLDIQIPTILFSAERILQLPPTLKHFRGEISVRLDPFHLFPRGLKSLELGSIGPNIICTPKGMSEMPPNLKKLIASGLLLTFEATSLIPATLTKLSCMGGETWDDHNIVNLINSKPNLSLTVQQASLTGKLLNNGTTTVTLDRFKTETNRALPTQCQVHDWVFKRLMTLPDAVTDIRLNGSPFYSLSTSFTSFPPGLKRLEVAISTNPIAEEAQMLPNTLEQLVLDKSPDFQSNRWFFSALPRRLKILRFKLKMTPEKVVQPLLPVNGWSWLIGLPESLEILEHPFLAITGDCLPLIGPNMKEMRVAVISCENVELEALKLARPGLKLT